MMQPRHGPQLSFYEQIPRVADCLPPARRLPEPGPTPDGTPPVEDANTSQAAPEPKQYASFSEETLYALLAAELAGQRNRFDIATGNYVQQANATRDPGVAERAFRIAEYPGAEQAAPTAR